jgi:hypothetical protein
MTSQLAVEEFLAHYGVKGMRWGVRKAEDGSGTSPVKGLDKFPEATATALSSVATKISSSYGFQISEVVPITGFGKKNYIAYVEAFPKGGGGVIHAKTDADLGEKLGQREKAGWFPPSGGHSIEAVMTHESAHAMYHVINLESQSLAGRFKSKEPMDDIRKTAWDAAIKQAVADGTIKPRPTGLRRFVTKQPEYLLSEKVSKYASSRLFLEETEAEMFSSYHWSPNPPKFIDAWMKEVHNQTGVNVKPFSGRKVS